MIALPPWFPAESPADIEKRIGAPDPTHTKEQRAAAFSHFIHHVPANDIVVYTDGSKLQNGNAGAGYALVLSEATVKEAFALGPSAEIFDAEAIAALLGAQAALRHSSNGLAKNAWICLDNLEVAKRLLSPSLTTSQPIFNSFIKTREDWQKRDNATPAGDIHIRWVPGHANIPGNDLADAEARKGSSQLPNAPYPLSFASLKKWHAQQASKARAEWWATSAHENYQLLSITLLSSLHRSSGSLEKSLAAL
jgi:ribonuclease HI